MEKEKYDYLEATSTIAESRYGGPYIVTIDCFTITIRINEFEGSLIFSRKLGDSEWKQETPEIYDFKDGLPDDVVENLNEIVRKAVKAAL